MATTWKQRLALSASVASRLTLNVFHVEAAVLVSTEPTCTQPTAAEGCTISAWYFEAVLETSICRDTSAGVMPTVLMQNSRPAEPLLAFAAG